MFFDSRLVAAISPRVFRGFEKVILLHFASSGKAPFDNCTFSMSRHRKGTFSKRNIISVFHTFGSLSGLKNFLGIPFLNNFLKCHYIEKYTRDKKKFPRPAEAYDFWNYYIPNFNNPDLIIDDIDYERVNKCKKTTY